MKISHMGEGSGRGSDLVGSNVWSAIAGRVGSDFWSAIAGRVGSTFCRVGSGRVGSGRVGSGRVGSKKSDPWTTLRWIKSGISRTCEVKGMQVRIASSRIGIRIPHLQHPWQRRLSEWVASGVSKTGSSPSTLGCNGSINLPKEICKAPLLQPSL